MEASSARRLSAPRSKNLYQGPRWYSPTKPLGVSSGTMAIFRSPAVWRPVRGHERNPASLERENESPVLLAETRRTWTRTRDLLGEMRSRRTYI